MLETVETAGVLLLDIRPPPHHLAAQEYTVLPQLTALNRVQARWVQWRHSRF